MKSLIAYSGLLFIKLSILPNVNLLLWMGIAIALDFITGFSKAVLLNQNRTSSAMRKTVTKFLQYGGGLAVGTILTQSAEQNQLESAKIILSFFNDALIVFIIYIELTSILENLIAIDDKSIMAQYIFVPLHKLFTFQLKNNPVSQAAAKLEDPTQDSFK